MSSFIGEQFEAHEYKHPELFERWQQLLSGDFSDGPPLNSYSLAYENVRVVKSGAGMLFGFSVYSSKAAAQWIHVFDVSPSSSGGVPSGAVPVAIFTVATVANLDVTWTFPGRFFSRGCILANSTTGPTYTAGAADTWFDAQYI